MRHAPSLTVLVRPIFTVILAISLSLGSWNPYLALARADVLTPECEAISETTLRVELNRLIQDFLTNETEFDVQSTVARQWRTLNLDVVFDAEVDAAIATVTKDAGMINRFKSSWIPAQAETLASQVTEQVFKGKTLNHQLDQLSQNVADELADQLQLMSAQSSSYAMDCLQRFINRQYSQAFVDIFGQRIQAGNRDRIPIPDAFDADTKTFLKTHTFAFGGAAALAVAGVTRQVIGKKIISRVTQQVIERVAGRLGTSVIPFVGEVIGGVMLTSDVINSFEGALPEIQTSLKEPEVKQNFQAKITQQIDQELRNESYQIAREVSNDIYAEWLDFQKDYRDTLNLAAELPEFQQLLANTTNIPKISALVGIALNNMGRSQLIDAIQSGDFERALFLPEVTYQMLATTHDLHTLIDWTNLAGNQVDEVVRLELYKHLAPTDLDRKVLRDILALQNDALVAKLALLDLASIQQLLEIAKPNLLTLSTHASAEDLKRLAHYLRGLNQTASNDFVRFLMDDPSNLRRESVEYIIHSRNIQAAIAFWKHDTSLPFLYQSLLQVATGQIAWKLFVSKYNLPLLITLAIAPFLILLILGISFTRFLARFSSRKSNPTPQSTVIVEQPTQPQTEVQSSQKTGSEVQDDREQAQPPQIPQTPTES